jgi:hypothetical protein
MGEGWEAVTAERITGLTLAVAFVALCAWFWSLTVKSEEFHRECRARGGHMVHVAGGRVCAKLDRL